MWGTPKFGTNHGDGQTNPTRGSRIEDQVLLWKTSHGLTFAPEAGDPGGGGEFAEKAANWEPSLPAHQIQDGLTLSQRVRILLRLCRLLRQRLPSPYNKARSIFKRKLNPSFVDWLMGWPDGYSSDERVFSAEEMASYLSVLRSRTQYLLGG
jgi:hypothetical protein